ncbi:hypothetical protein GBA65_14195 [Rubrobacter marinus]|uniref:Uncharacterized protein n=1 Tax=Rubrobacter marinus TaxID=2653852 RepID=A0A6G8PYZ7_9ACTN|nr:chitobiase/beta-hexosaminidase C-terminal domain-containing protein [Rubrobacter marinus]QIN79474.1 hypothetical protein GBA65_14195 [Rubrobacter marinus]
MKSVAGAFSPRKAWRPLLGGLAAAAVMTGVMALPARAELNDAGPINPDNGFPFWYEDAPGGTKLDLCLNPKAAVTPEDAPNPGEPIPGGGYCLTPFEMPDENTPVAFPENFPGEAFWWTSEAHIDPPADDPNGPSALLVLAQEAAFANEEPKEGDQMSFGRIRVRLNDVVPGATYKITHPYGVDTVVAEDKDGDPATPNDGRVFVTEDIGCFPSAITPCDFDKALTGRIGPFLKWDPAVAPAPPEGYVGDPDVPHEVVGSPNGTNFFKVEQIRDGEGRPLAQPVLVGETNLFAVTGKLAELQVAAQAVGADRGQTVFNDANQGVKLVASDETPETKIYYTTDGSEPGVVDPETGRISGTPYSGEEIRLGSDPQAATGTPTTVKAVAINGDQRSKLLEKTYVVDLVAPNVLFSDLPSKLDGPGDLTITTSEKARVYYTTDGSDPKVATNPARKSFVYDPAPGAENAGNVLNVARSQTVRAAAVDLVADPETGQETEQNWSQTKSRKFTVTSLAKAGPINPQNGFPFWYEDHDGTRLDMCLNPVAAPEAGGGYCATPFEMPADWQPADGVAFPDRFPGEAFWWTGEAGMDTSDRGSADLIMALEAAFLNEEPKASDRMVFGRVRIRIDDLVIGETYKVTHPYGVDTYVAEDNGKGVGEINVTEDIGCMMPSTTEPCDFDEARYSRVGPFLTLKDKALEPANAPDGGRYLADPVLDQDVVTGSPIMAPQDPTDPNSPMVPANFFRVEGPGISAVADEEAGATANPNRGTAEHPYIQTDFFSVVGKYSEFQAAANKVGGFYNTPQGVVLGASEFDARLFYNFDGVPQLDANGEPTDGTEEFITEARARQLSAETGTQVEPSGPISIPDAGETTLRYMATSASRPSPTRVYEETYKMDAERPVVTLQDDPQASTVLADGTRVFENVNPAVRLDVANEPGKVKVFYTTNGSDPSDATNVDRKRYDAAQPIAVRKDTTLTFWAVDEAGNASHEPGQFGSQAYSIRDTLAPGAPTVGLDAASDTGASASDRITSATTLAFTGSAEPGSTVRIQVGGAERGSVTAAENGSFRIDVGPLAQGAHSITATATDPSGNGGAASGPYTVTVDTRAPSIAATPPAGTYPRAQNVTLTPNEQAKIYYTLNGGDPVPGAPGTIEGRSLSITANSTVRSVAVDAAGNTSGTFVAEYRIRNAVPAITNMSPTATIADRTPLIAATVRDGDSQLDKANIVRLTVNGTNIARGAFAYNANTDRLTYLSPNRAPGRYNVSLTVRDDDGGTTTRTWSFRIR